MVTEDTESMNSPVSKTRLTEMYQKLKLLQWPKIKDHLKSKNTSPAVIKALIQVKCVMLELYYSKVHYLGCYLFH